VIALLFGSINGLIDEAVWKRPSSFVVLGVVALSFCAGASLSGICFAPWTCALWFERCAQRALERDLSWLDRLRIWAILLVYMSVWSVTFLTRLLPDQVGWLTASLTPLFYLCAWLSFLAFGAVTFFYKAAPERSLSDWIERWRMGFWVEDFRHFAFSHILWAVGWMMTMGARWIHLTSGGSESVLHQVGAVWPFLLLVVVGELVLIRYRKEITCAALQS
jgi:hypothetical protein